jgi:hypothetical protein
MYKLMFNKLSNKVDTVQKLSDGTWIPLDPANTDYQAYLKWLEESPDNTPLPADE